MRVSGKIKSCEEPSKPQGAITEEARLMHK